MGRRTDLPVIAPPKGLTASRMSGSGPKIFNFPGTKRPLSCVRGALGGWFMAPSRAAAYRHHAQGCLRLADLMTSPEHRVRFHSLGFPRSLVRVRSGCAGCEQAGPISGLLPGRSPAILAVRAV